MFESSQENKFWERVGLCTACKTEGKPRTTNTFRGATVSIGTMCDSHFSEFRRLPDHVVHPVTGFDMI